MNQKYIKILVAVGIYLLSTGLSFTGFTLAGQSSPDGSVVSPLANISPSPKAQFKVDPQVPRDQICPLNGAKYTAKEKDDWSTRRPMAVMMENSEDARPQSGLSRADIIYEALAEGWITRFMAVYYCNTPFENITVAPVRSARTYFIDWVSEYDSLYVHVGGSNRIGENANITDRRADALGQIDQYGIKDLDQFGIGYPDCYRNPDRLDHPVATEHTMVCFTDNLYKIAQKRGWTNVDSRGIAWDKNFKEWSFADDATPAERGTVAKASIVFAQGYEKYHAVWDYDATSNTYKRSTGGVVHLDLDTNTPLTVKNVVVQLTKLTGPVDDHGHMLYTTIGSGKAVIFQNGKVIVGTWSKKSRIGRTEYFDNTGKAIQFVRGPIWIELLPSEEQLTY